MQWLEKFKTLPFVKSLFKGTVLKEKDGLGVLSNGMPYLNLSQAAKFCGVEEDDLAAIVNDWAAWQKTKDGQALKAELEARAYFDDNLVILVNDKDAPVFPVTVCTALIHYFADYKGNDTAKRNIRRATDLALTEIIYSHVDYFPYGEAPHKAYFERVDLNNGNVPDGFFGIFHENTSMVLRLFDMGIIVDESTVPDISVGMAWSKYWKAQNLEEKYGFSKKYSHVYPASYPQSAVNNYPSNCYPEDALGAFRKWQREIYMKDTYPKYIQSKLKNLNLPQYQKDLIESKITGTK